MGWLAAAFVAMLMAITPATATSPAVRGTAFQLVEQHPLPSVCQPGSRVRGVDVGTRKIVAFSFDDGPWPSYTERIMASFESRGLRATFFMVGINIQSYRSIAQAVHDRGHEIGNHSMTHTYNTSTIAREIPIANELISQITGFSPNLFRAPGLAESPAITAAMTANGVCNVFSTIVLGDHLDPRLSSSTLCSRFANTLHPGEIVLLHDGGSHLNTVNAVPCMLDIAIARGYEIVPVSELMLSGIPYSGPRP